MITGKLYNWLKFLALVTLPAVATLYLALALPESDIVSGTIMAVDTFLGGLIYISSVSYNSSTTQGTLAIQEMGDRKVFNLELDGDPEQDLEGKNRVVFKVEKREAPEPIHMASRRRK